MGEQIKLARKRRTLSLAVIAERAQCTQLTLMRVEKGSPTVSIGIYARVLYALGLDESILLLARDDKAGEALVNTKLIRKNQKKTWKNTMYLIDIIAAFDYLEKEVKIGTLEYERIKGSASFRFSFEKPFLDAVPILYK